MDPSWVRIARNHTQIGQRRPSRGACLQVTTAGTVQAWKEKYHWLETRTSSVHLLKTIWVHFMARRKPEGSPKESWSSFIGGDWKPRRFAQQEVWFKQQKRHRRIHIGLNQLAWGLAGDIPLNYVDFTGSKWGWTGFKLSLLGRRLNQASWLDTS